TKQEILDNFGEMLGLHRDADFVAFPPTPLQAGMISATMLDRSAYIYQRVFKATESVDAGRLVAALESLLAQTDLLRSSFVVTASEGVCQVIRPTSSDTRLRLEQAETGLEEFLAADLADGFDVGRKDWIRVTLLRPADGAHYVVVTMHHVLYDGWSMDMVASDLFGLYFSQDVVPRPSFRAFAGFVHGQDREKSRVFWNDYLRGVGPAEQLLGGRFGGPIVEVADDSLIELSCKRPVAELAKVASTAGVTLAILAKAAWALTLGKYLRKREVVFGQLVATRDAPIADIDRRVAFCFMFFPFSIVPLVSRRVAQLSETDFLNLTFIPTDSCLHILKMCHHPLFRQTLR
ncbi:condensation domain-containing protein, partial [Zopfochytrium polystomum]